MKSCCKSLLKLHSALVVLCVVLSSASVAVSDQKEPEGKYPDFFVVHSKDGSETLKGCCKPIKSNSTVTEVSCNFITSRIQPPGMWAFLFWRKPASVVVQHPDGTDEVLEVPDITRQAQISILGMTLFITLVFGLFTFLRAKNSKKE